MKIKSKLVLNFGILILLSILIVGINFITFTNMESDSSFVNQAGTLRAMNFKMAKLSNQVVSSENPSANEGLENTMAQFEQTLKDVTEGNEELSLEKPTMENTIVGLEQINKRWTEEFKPALLSIK